MLIDYYDYLEINSLLVEIEKQTNDQVIRQKAEEISRLLEKSINE